MGDLQNSARANYRLNLPRYERLKDEVEFMLNQVVAEAQVKVHHVSARVKELDSYLAKFERKPSISSLDEVHDLVGGRVVTLFRSDLDALDGSIRDYFWIDEAEDKVESAADDTFGYMSRHYVCRIGPFERGPRYTGLHDLTFEIQTRTILMDAWANVSHYIDYKGESSIPAELRRDFNALSALFYLADGNFERFYQESKESKAKAERSVKRAEEESIPLDADTLRAALREWFPDRGRVDDQQENPPSPGPDFAEDDFDGRFLDGGFLRALLGIAYPSYEARLGRFFDHHYERYREE